MNRLDTETTLTDAVPLDRPCVPTSGPSLHEVATILSGLTKAVERADGYCAGQRQTIAEQAECIADQARNNASLRNQLEIAITERDKLFADLVALRDHLAAVAAERDRLAAQVVAERIETL